MNGGLWNVAPIQKLAMVPEPDLALVFMEEADSRNFNLGPWVITVYSREWVDSVAVFHGNISSVSMADGHVEAHKWLEPSTLRASLAAQNNLETPFYWPKNTPRDRDFEWVERRYKYAQWPRGQP